MLSRFKVPRGAINRPAHVRTNPWRHSGTNWRRFHQISVYEDCYVALWIIYKKHTSVEFLVQFTVLSKSHDLKHVRYLHIYRGIFCCCRNYSGPIITILRMHPRPTSPQYSGVPLQGRTQSPLAGRLLDLRRRCVEIIPSQWFTAALRSTCITNGKPSPHGCDPSAANIRVFNQVIRYYELGAGISKVFAYK